MSIIIIPVAHRKGKKSRSIILALKYFRILLESACQLLPRPLQCPVLGNLFAWNSAA